MRYRYLGWTGVQVSEYMLGTMSFGSDGNTDEREWTNIVHGALDCGINFIDTADTYSHGEAEEIVGKALAGRRDKVVLATKFRLSAGDVQNDQGGSRYWIMKQVENSLRRLKTDLIDSYQLHRPDLHTDLEATVGALSDLVTQGKVRTRNARAGRKLAEELRQVGCDVLILEGNLRDPAVPEYFIHTAAGGSKDSTIDAIVSNAGAVDPTSLEDMSLEV